MFDSGSISGLAPATPVFWHSGDGLLCAGPRDNQFKYFQLPVGNIFVNVVLEQKKKAGCGHGPVSDNFTLHFSSENWNFTIVGAGEWAVRRQKAVVICDAKLPKKFPHEPSHETSIFNVTCSRNLEIGFLNTDIGTVCDEYSETGCLWLWSFSSKIMAGWLKPPVKWSSFNVG